jgi:hypothetical protein
MPEDVRRLVETPVSPEELQRRLSLRAARFPSKKARRGERSRTGNKSAAIRRSREGN